MEENGIETVEACGITVDVNKANLNDVRFSTAMGALSDETVPLPKKMVWYVRALEVLFEGRTYDIQTQLAKANGGILSAEVFDEFFRQVLERLSAKNS